MDPVPGSKLAELPYGIIRKYDRNADGMEEKILSLYACGMSHRDISEQIKEPCHKVSSIKTRRALRRPLSNRHRAYFFQKILKITFLRKEKWTSIVIPLTASRDVRKKGSCHMKSSSHAQRCLNGLPAEGSPGNRPILCILLHSTRVLQTMFLFLAFSIYVTYCT